MMIKDITLWIIVILFAMIIENLLTRLYFKRSSINNES